MKKFFRVAGIVVGIIVVLIIGFLIYFNASFPKAEKVKDIKVEVTPARVTRGEYLANHVAGCMDCHSGHDWTMYSGPLIPGSLGKGGEKYDQKSGGVPGVIYAKNITPAGIGDWSDGELIRAITTGVAKDGTALFPLMPYTNFNRLSKEDLYSIVAYIRSLKPIENNVPDRHLDFPMNLIVKTIPLKSYNPAPQPDTSNTILYGKYLATIASCADCHTQMVKGEPVKGMEFAGGMEFGMQSGIVRSANITPDNETGIGKWSKNQFINFFKAFDTDSTKNIHVKPHEFNTIMPITFYAGMTTTDLGAIYTYLRTIKPVHNKVVKLTPVD